MKQIPPTQKDWEDRGGSYEGEDIPGWEKSSDEGEDEGGEGVTDDHHHQRHGAARYPAVFNNFTKSKHYLVLAKDFTNDVRQVGDSVVSTADQKP